MAVGTDWRSAWNYFMVYSDDEDDRSRRTSTTTEPSSVTFDERSSGDDDVDLMYDVSMTGVDALVYDDEAYRNMSRMFNRDRRCKLAKKTCKSSKQTKFGQFKPNPASRKQSRALDGGFLSVPSAASAAATDEDFLRDVEVTDGIKMFDIEKRKRSVEQLRTSERDAKWEIIEPRTPESVDGGSLPSQAALKVDTTNCFRSLNSKPVISKECEPSSGAVTPCKVECSQDRHEFWTIFSLLVRMGNPDRKNKDERNFARQVRASSPQPELKPPQSQEEHVWQNKLNDLVWLSLRAWYSGRSIRDEDSVLCTERERIRFVLDEVMNFTFRPPIVVTGGRHPPGTFTDPTVSLPDDVSSQSSSSARDPKRPTLQIPLPHACTWDTVEEADWSAGYPCCGLCSIFCHTCLVNQNEALDQVTDILNRLDEVERLYPSSRAMMKEWDLYQSEEFTGRVKSLCLFFNMVTDLRHKICMLGKLQASIGSKNLPWPSFVPGGRTRPVGGDLEPPALVSDTECQTNESNKLGDGCSEHSSSTSGSSVSAMDSKQQRERKSSKCVRFLKASEDHRNSLTLKVDSVAVDGSSGDSGYGPASLTPTSISPAGDILSPITSCSSPAAPHGTAPGSGGWTWGEASTPVQSGCSTPVYPASGASAYYAAAAAATSSTSSSPYVLNRSFSDQSVDGTVITPYRRYVDRLLKTKGLRKIFASLMDLIRNTLMRSKIALERLPASQKPAPVMSPDLPGPSAPDSAQPTSTGTNEKLNYHGKRSTLSFWDDDGSISEELRRFGPWGQSFREMALPSFRSLYLFLARIPLDVMHECLQLRLEQQPREPSSLSIRQLMRECKEAIKASVVVRQKFLRVTRTILVGAELEQVEHQMVEFDAKVERMLQSYLSYFQSWVQMVIKAGPQQQTTPQKNVLEDEWTFIKVFSRYVQRGEALACETFCSLACSMFEGTGDNLDSGLDKCTSLLYDSIGPSFSMVDRGGIRVVGGGGNIGDFSRGGIGDASPDAISGAAGQSRQAIWQCCREYKDAFQEARKRALKAITFAKMLRKDLEIAAEFRIDVSIADLLTCLRDTGHVRLIAPHSSCFIIFIPGHIEDNRQYLWQLLSMTYGHEHSAAPDNADSEGYLVILRCENCGRVPGPWSGPTVVIEPTAEITITLSHLNVEGLLLVVNHSSQLGIQRKAFQRAMGASVVTLTKEFTSCNQSIAESLGDLKREAIALQCKITRAIQDVENRLSMDSISDLDELDRSSLQARFREVLHQCYKFGFEYQKEVTRLVTGESRSELGDGLIGFASQWMRFVLERCERGRGVRPRWANQGLEFLMMACEPQYLKTVSDDEFQRLKRTMNECIAHLIGSADNKMSSTPSGIGSRSHSPTPHSRTKFRPSSSYSEPSTRQPRASSSSSNLTLPWSAADEGKTTTTTTTPEADEDVDEGNESDPDLAMTRIQRAIHELDARREENLRSSNMIGRVRDVLVETTVHINARRVTFRWQRGNKIGQGRFGKVYAAVNTDTGELMALKEIHLQPNDHKTIREVADELRIFEGIKHPYLVRYYGVEIHREQMFIFMEYCDGTLEHAAELGLPEPQIRKYTRQLLESVCVLHEHGIVHRDIKGANIFLTSDGNLKLGDFGCCVKLKNHTTMPGELNSFVGTQAYMAPEVFTKTVTEGHGRAADIWSVGCVVLEMFTGHRPWHELENNYQIMFKVGMGETPEIPYAVSQEGQDFLDHCFRFDPRERWTAISLLDHPFTKVDSDEDFQSMTFLPDAHLFLHKLSLT